MTGMLRVDDTTLPLPVASSWFAALLFKMDYF